MRGGVEVRRPSRLTTSTAARAASREVADSSTKRTSHADGWGTNGAGRFGRVAFGLLMANALLAWRLRLFSIRNTDREHDGQECSWCGAAQERGEVVDGGRREIEEPVASLPSPVYRGEGETPLQGVGPRTRTAITRDRGIGDCADRGLPACDFVAWLSRAGQKREGLAIRR